MKKHKTNNIFNMLLERIGGGGILHITALPCNHVMKETFLGFAASLDEICEPTDYPKHSQKIMKP